MEDEQQVSSVNEAAIDSLPPRRKEVYLLSRHERLTYEEIAQQLWISKESVKIHLKLATASLSAFIKAHLTHIILAAATLLRKN